MPAPAVAEVSSTHAFLVELEHAVQKLKDGGKASEERRKALSREVFKAYWQCLERGLKVQADEKIAPVHKPLRA